MNIFKKRESLIENMTYMAIMSAVNVIFVLLATFLPIILFFLIFLLTLSSTIVSLYCKKRYFPIYIVVTLAICLLINYSDTLFYVFPSLISGLICGVFLRNKFSLTILLITLTTIQIGFTYISIPLIEVLTGRNFIYDVVHLFKLDNSQYLSYITHLFVFAISFIQVVVTFIFVHYEIKHIYQDDDKEVKGENFELPVMGIVIFSILIFSFFYKELTYDFLFISIIISIKFTLELIFEKRKIIWVLLGFSEFLTLFLFAVQYSFIPQPLGFLSLSFYPILVIIIFLINKCLLKKVNIG